MKSRQFEGCTQKKLLLKMQPSHQENLRNITALIAVNFLTKCFSHSITVNTDVSLTVFEKDIQMLLATGRAC